MRPFSIYIVFFGSPKLRSYPKTELKKKENKHTWALTVFPPILILLVANSTPIVDFDSASNSFRVNRESKQDFPTPESPVKTILCK